MKVFNKIYLILLFLPLLITGCIKEDLSDCPNGLRVYFSYESSLNPAEVDRMNLYVFDNKGIFVGTWYDETPQLSSSYFMTVPNLSAGDYRFVAWGSVRDCYSITPASFVPGQTTLSEALLYFSRPADNIVTTAPRPLFFATKDATVLPAQEQTVTLPLVQNHNKINLTTEGISSSGDLFRLVITDNNGKYNFDNSFATDANFHYTTLCNQDANGQPAGTLTVLRIASYRHPIIEIYNDTKGRLIYSADLVTLLNATPGINYETMHEFNIHISFNADLSTDVSVNGWQVTDDGESILK